MGDTKCDVGNDVCLADFILPWPHFHISLANIKFSWFRLFIGFNKQLFNYIWCMKWLYGVHVCLVGFIWALSHVHGSIFNVNLSWTCLFLRYFKQYVNYILCMEWLHGVHMLSDRVHLIPTSFFLWFIGSVSHII